MTWSRKLFVGLINTGTEVTCLRTLALIIPAINEIGRACQAKCEYDFCDQEVKLPDKLFKIYSVYMDKGWK